MITTKETPRNLHYDEIIYAINHPAQWQFIDPVKPEAVVHYDDDQAIINDGCVKFYICFNGQDQCLHFYTYTYLHTNVPQLPAVINLGKSDFMAPLAPYVTQPQLRTMAKQWHQRFLSREFATQFNQAQRGDTENQQIFNLLINRTLPVDFCSFTEFASLLVFARINTLLYDKVFVNPNDSFTELAANKIDRTASYVKLMTPTADDLQQLQQKLRRFIQQDGNTSTRDAVNAVLNQYWHITL